MALDPIALAKIEALQPILKSAQRSNEELKVLVDEVSKKYLELTENCSLLSTDLSEADQQILRRRLLDLELNLPAK